MTRVLWLSNETPARTGQGGQRRQFFQIESLLQRGHHIHVVTLQGPQRDDELRKVASVERVRTHFKGRRLPTQLRGTVRRRIESGSWDRVVVAHGESQAMLSSSWELPPLLVDLHNVYSVWNESLGRDQEAQEARELELRALNHAQTVSVCSEAERQRLLRGLRTSTPVVVAMHGVDPSEWPEVPRQRAEAVVAAFGGWNWLPNQRGMEWFLAEVWSRVRTAVPQARFEIAGSGLDWLDQPIGGVVKLGRVQSLVDVLARATVVVAPVKQGVGASMKFAESLASGAPVAATADAASAAPESPCFVSDNPNEWSEWIIERLRGRAHAPAMTAERAYALERLTWYNTVAAIDRWLSN